MAEICSKPGNLTHLHPSDTWCTSGDIPDDSESDEGEAVGGFERPSV